MLSDSQRLFFLYCYGDHLVLHSFPTRRSSDLTLVAAGTTRCSPSRPVRSSSAPGVAARSEEHTSELQSRGHLVCRLLLEKKKNTIHQIIYESLLQDIN